MQKTNKFPAERAAVKAASHSCRCVTESFEELEQRPSDGAHHKSAPAIFYNPNGTRLAVVLHNENPSLLAIGF